MYILEFEEDRVQWIRIKNLVYDFKLLVVIVCMKKILLKKVLDEVVII